jgi:mannosyltransferase OCH1-like enzyme
MRYLFVIIISAIFVILLIIWGIYSVHTTHKNKDNIERLSDYMVNLKILVNMSNKKLKLDYPVYYTNMDKNTDRNNFIISQLSTIDCKYTRVRGYDGFKITNKKHDSVDGVEFINEYPDLSKGEIGCTMAHILAIETAYKNGDEIAIICEDDCVFEMLYLTKPISDTINNAPADWTIMQLYSMIHDNDLIPSQSDIITYIPRTPTCKIWSTVCYVINRKGMKNVMDWVGNNPYKIIPLKENKNSSYEFPYNGISDVYIYNICGPSYSVYPNQVLVDNTYLDSTIHTNHTSQHIKFAVSDLDKYKNILMNAKIEDVKTKYFISPYKNMLKLYSKTTSPIPKIIHQTWKSHTLPPDYERWSARIREMHPDYEYKLWTDKDNRDFIKEEYPWFIPTYDNYDVNIKRVDAVRYFLLYHYGGIYIDLDMTTIRSLDGLIKGEDGTAVFGYQLRDTEADGSIANAFMASPPKHILFDMIINSLVYTKDEKDVIASTGPKFLTKFIRAYKDTDVRVHQFPVIYNVEWDENNPDVEVCDKDMNTCVKLFPDSYLATFWTGSWLSPTKEVKPSYAGRRVLR